LEKLFATIAAESGLRVSTILQLRWRHIKDDYNNRTDSIAIRLEPPFYKGKKKAGYAFIGTRSRQLLQYCIEKRLINTQPESQLFPFSYDSISKIIRRAKNKTDLDPDATIEPIHGLRKYTEAQLEATKPPINERYRIMIMGRFKDIDAKDYSPRDFETLRPEYELAYPYIDYTNTSPEETQELSTKQTQLQDKIDNLSKQLNELKQQRHQTYETMRDGLIMKDVLPPQELFTAWIQFQTLLKTVQELNTDTEILQQLTPQQSKPKPIE